MNYIEHIFVCLALPMLLAILCTDRTRRVSLLFLFAGMTVCLLCSYISSFLAELDSVDSRTAAMEISPVVEEAMKILPVLFGLLVFELSEREAANGILMTAIGFATFENVCFLSTNGAADLTGLLIRGAATGAMHIVCGYLVGLALLVLWKELQRKAAGTVAIICLAMLYHSVYNLLVSQSGTVRMIGYALPLVTLLPAVTIKRRFFQDI